MRYSCINIQPRKIIFFSSLAYHIVENYLHYFCISQLRAAIVLTQKVATSI